MTTPKLSLPELSVSQAGKEITHNQALAAIDQLAMPRVVTKGLSAPPGSPANGAMYIVGASATGAWAGKDKNLAWWLTSTANWTFIAPSLGLSVRVLDELDASNLAKVYAYSSSGTWVEQPTGGFSGGTLTSALNEAPPVTIASASTVNIGAAAANTITISGTTAITAFDTIAAGALRRLVFIGALTLTHNGTSLILPTASNITTASGDSAEFISLGSGNWRCTSYLRASGAALIGSGSSSVPAVTTFTGNKTLGLTDINTFAVSQDGTAQNVTIPAQSSVVWTTDAELHIQQGGAGAVTVVAATGVSINGVSAASFILGGQFSTVTLKRRASNDWTIVGVVQGNQTITGNLTLSGNNRVLSALLDGSSNSSYVQTSAPNAATTFQLLPSGTGTSATYSAYNKSDKSLQFFTMGISSGSIGLASWAGGGSALPLAISIGLSASWQVDASSPYAFRPGADNTQPLGTASFRCSTIYAGTGTINTSDAREKTSVRPLTSAEIECGLALSREIGGFQFLAAIADKGDAARTHIGMTVQRAIEIIERHGLSPFAYSFICYDQWDEQQEIWDIEPAREAEYDEFGNVIVEALDEKRTLARPYLAAGDRFSFRETGLIQFMLRALSADRDNLESRISALESRP